MKLIDKFNRKWERMPFMLKPFILGVVLVILGFLFPAPNSFFAGGAFIILTYVFVVVFWWFSGKA